MGMTIDESIAQLVRVKHYAAPRHYETLDMAIDTMRKYQKIEAYMKKLEKNGQYGTLRKLKIVLGEIEDGNDRA